jgi:glycosyltransferase involved in cell wall biosynthesis
MSSSHTERPLVSVVIPTYNGLEFLAETIGSVLAQTYRPIEVLVIDDGSTDGQTRQVIESYGAPVRYIHQANAGTAAARNTGIANARGEFVALLDHDDLWLPEKLERQMPAFGNAPRLGVAFAAIEFFDAATGRVTSHYFPAEKLDFHALVGHKVLPIQTVIFRKSVLEEIGPFDVTLRGTDDWDIGIRIAARYDIAGIPETLARVRLHKGQQGANAQRMFRNAMGVLDKNRGSLHPGCRECRRAFAYSRRLLREDYAGSLRGRAWGAIRKRRYAAAAMHCVGMVWQDPSALTRLASRCVGNTKKSCPQAI